MTCGQQIKIAKIDNAGPNSKKKWDKYELDGITLHVYHKPQQQKLKQQPSNSNNNNLSKEIAAITEIGTSITLLATFLTSILS
jgi:hypothetical protein